MLLNTYADLIRWNDVFSGKCRSSLYERQYNNPRYEKKVKGIYIINRNQTLEFLKANNIKFIIRGHQDNYGNSFIINTELKVKRRKTRI
jgi:hypothetical protein